MNFWTDILNPYWVWNPKSWFFWLDVMKAWQEGWEDATIEREM